MSVILTKLGLLHILTKEMDRLNEEQQELASSSIRNPIQPSKTEQICTTVKPKILSRGIIHSQNLQTFSSVIEMNESFEEEDEMGEGKNNNEKRPRNEVGYCKDNLGF